ncbi:hypothetical protein ILUMI_00429 [Ignelater luminosus]|uniref:Coiled-coil domain-containing protein KIAA1407 n=1 Tax=Ignelater luminosus TaxID=2038154 RepID=A0A8K0DLX8_IGNLU|nr:hypothetical protein ILUMI_00429 [Ignelater luminosus]
MTKIDENTIMETKCCFEFQVKRATATHDLEKYANNILSDANIENIITNNSSNGTKKVCRQSLSWKDDRFWKELPQPNLQIKQKSLNNVNDNFKQSKLVDIQPCSLPIFKRNENQESNNKQTGNCRNSLNLVKEFFERWRYFTRKKKEHRSDLEQQIEQKEKIDNFLKRLKKLQNNKSQQCNSITKLECNSNNSNIKELMSLTHHSKTPESACYKHRFEAQQSIIQMQKQKLIRQEKVIQELKLGKLGKEINQSLEETEKEIRETLNKCSVKVKSKMGPTFKVENIVEDETLNFQINSGKAPKIVQQMEKRALERERKRQIILERKQLLDKLKKEAIQMEIEKKKVLDEEERKKHIREIKERRRKEMEIQQLKQIRKQKFLENCERADNLYRRKLVKFAFKGFSKLMIIKEDNEIRSELFYEKHLKKICWNSWKKYIMDIENSRVIKAKQFYDFGLKRRIFKAWHNECTISIQHLQVAEDLFEFQLQSRLFMQWRRYVCGVHILETTNLLKTQRHYNNRILLHYFYLWKLLPAVMKLEKAKEEKKRKWREKVWEILPDYTPAVED